MRPCIQVWKFRRQLHTWMHFEMLPNLGIHACKKGTRKLNEGTQPRRDNGRETPTGRPRHTQDLSDKQQAYSLHEAILTIKTPIYLFLSISRDIYSDARKKNMVTKPSFLSFSYLPTQLTPSAS